jgi:6-phosphogluconolactonase (cycloisomerase 2 family)
MNRKWLRSVLLLLLPLLAGCKNFWVTPSNTCTTNCSTVSSGIFYVLNSNQGQTEVAGYSIVSGVLTPLTGSPCSVPSGPYSIAVAPNNSYLYVSTLTGIYLYTIGTQGELTLASTKPILSDLSAYTMQVDSTNSWLVEASGSGFLYAIPISPLDGTVTGTVQQVALPGILSHGLAISSDNKYVFVALGGSGTAVVPFAAANADPLPSAVATLIAVKSAGGSAVSVAVDPSDRLFYIGETLATSGTSNTGGLRAFNYSSLTGTPGEVSGSPFATGGLEPSAILPTASGNYVYVANATVSNSSTGNISGFAVATTGAIYSLSALSSPTTAGVTPEGLAEDSTGNVLLLVNAGGSPDLAAYTFDAVTPGKLDSLLTSATGTDPVGARAVVSAP